MKKNNLSRARGRISYIIHFIFLLYIYIIFYSNNIKINFIFHKIGFKICNNNLFIEVNVMCNEFDMNLFYVIYFN